MDFLKRIYPQTIIKERRDHEIKVFVVKKKRKRVLKPKTPHLVTPLMLDSEDYHAIHPRLSKNLGPCPC